MDKDKNPPANGSTAPQGKAAEAVARPGGANKSADQSAQGASEQSGSSREAVSQTGVESRKDKADSGVHTAGTFSDTTTSDRPASAKAAPKGPPPTDSPTSAQATESSASSSARSKEKKVRRRGKGTWFVLLLLVILALLAYYLWPLYGDRLPFLARETAEATQAQPIPGSRSSAVTGQDQGVEREESPEQLAADTPVQSELSVTEHLEAERQLREEMIGELRDEMADLRLQVDSHTDRLRQLSTTSREDWLLAEAEYLLRLASQRLLTERQAANAVALMESADAILRDLNDPDLYPVRKALADGITQVKMAEAIDREGMFLRIGALVDAVDSLDSSLPHASEEPSSTGYQEPSTWYGRLADNIRQAAIRMVGLVRVERRAIPLQPPLTAEQEQVLRYNLKVVLEQARLALLREEQTIYVESLARAADWVDEHFAQNARTAAFMAELDKLRGQSISQELPSLMPSLQALQTYIRLWHNRHDPGTPPASSGTAEDGGESP